ncbi:hypothetical protein BC827DRAFT_15442 [Russula dissimulans]|nr:hypothetical protein BC827DRAFT_15442 [Russula dissimulans]
MMRTKTWKACFVALAHKPRSLSTFRQCQHDILHEQPPVGHPIPSWKTSSLVVSLRLPLAVIPLLISISHVYLFSAMNMNRLWKLPLPMSEEGYRSLVLCVVTVALWICPPPYHESESPLASCQLSHSSDSNPFVEFLILCRSPPCLQRVNQPSNLMEMERLHCSKDDDMS